MTWMKSDQEHVWLLLRTVWSFCSYPNECIASTSSIDHIVKRCKKDKTPGKINLLGPYVVNLYIESHNTIYTFGTVDISLSSEISHHASITFSRQTNQYQLAWAKDCLQRWMARFLSRTSRVSDASDMHRSPTPGSVQRFCRARTNTTPGIHAQIQKTNSTWNCIRTWLD